MKAFLRFNQGLLGMPIAWRLWLGLLVVSNALMPMFFLPQIEAVASLAAMFFSMGLMTLLTHWTGFSRLWIRAVIVLDVASLLIDAGDVARWLAGDRGETVEFAS